MSLTNSTEGFADPLVNAADIALTTRPLSTDELALARDARLGRLDGPGQSDIIALDALVPVAAPGQQAGTISLTDLARVFAGEVTNWAELGGTNAPITLHLGAATSGLEKGFIGTMLTATGRELGPGIYRHDTDAALLSAVLTDPDVFGVLAFGTFGDAQPLVLRGTCGRPLALTLVQPDWMRRRSPI